MASIYTSHFIQFFDDDGNPLSGGKLYTYAAGTTTPKATYTTAAGITSNANPVIMDSAGRATVFLSGAYKFRLEDSLGNLVEETDNVTAFSTAESGVDDIIANFSEAVIASGDSFIFSDVSDANTTRRDTIQGILDLTLQAGTQAEIEAQTANKGLDGANAKYHPLMPKAWCLFNGSGTVSMTSQSGFSTSITDNGTGDYTLTLSTEMSSANYAVFGNIGDSTDGTDACVKVYSRTSSTIRIRTTNNGSPTDYGAISVVVFGDL